MSTPRETLGAYIRQTRKQSKMKQAHFAEMCGVTQSHLSLIEKGKRAPSIDVLDTLCNGLGLELRIEFTPKQRQAP